MTFDYAGRVVRLQERMGETGVDVTLLSVGADLPYFTGCDGMPSERLTVLVMPMPGYRCCSSPTWRRPGCYRRTSAPAGDKT